MWSKEMKALRTAFTVLALTATALPAFAQSSNNSNQDGFGNTARQNDLPGCSAFPAPASTGTKVGLSYFGPPPSTVNPSLVGPVQLLASGQLDAINGRITLPLYKGYMTGTKI